jgi:hypothetical protein
MWLCQAEAERRMIASIPPPKQPYQFLLGQQPFETQEDPASRRNERVRRPWSRRKPAGPSTISLLHALDDGMQALHAKLGNCHWSNHLVEDPRSYSSPPKLHDLDVVERGSRDLLGHLIEIGLTSHVEALVKSDPNLLRVKKGRPYLDYALRCKLEAPFRSKHPEQTHPSYAMIELLLKLGCDVNEVVHVHGDRTVWDSYLYYIYDQGMCSGRDCKIVWLLLKNDAGLTGDRFLPPQNRFGEAATRQADHDGAYEVKTRGWADSTLMGSMMSGVYWGLAAEPRGTDSHVTKSTERVCVLSIVAILMDLLGATEAEVMHQYMLQRVREKSSSTTLQWLWTWIPTMRERTQYTWENLNISPSQRAWLRADQFLQLQDKT